MRMMTHAGCGISPSELEQRSSCVDLIARGPLSAVVQCIERHFRRDRSPRSHGDSVPGQDVGRVLLTTVSGSLGRF